MILGDFNKKTNKEARDLLFQCCGATKWADALLAEFPFASEQSLVDLATDLWYNACGETDWKEAFTHHPKIGDVKSLAEKFASTKHLASAEQAGVEQASKATIQALADANAAYDKKNGFSFIVCATGKSADEMLRLLQDRLNNSPAEELRIAMGEQHKISILRLKKLMPDADWSSVKGSQLTTHVLDTSLGHPGKNICIRLQDSVNGNWQTMAQGVTNSDGRISDLLPPGRILTAKDYKMVFDTAAYFNSTETKGFYPNVDIQFTVEDDTHYHVPLLINPYGYSTYRGS